MEAAAEARVEGTKSRRCFVGNLAWRTSWQDLKDKFRECGGVVYANVMHYEDGRSKGWGIVEFETVEEAAAAIETLNGVDMGGRKLLVREDREDRDLKQGGGGGGGGGEENGAAPAPRAPRAGRGAAAGAGGRGGRGTGGRGAGAGGRGGRGSAPPERTGESSGLQVVVRGIPWSYTWRELKDLFAEVEGVDRTDVVYGDDGRSRGYGTVRFFTAEAAQAAIAKYHETELDGRSLSVFLDKFA